MTGDGRPRFEDAGYATLKYVGRLEDKVRRLESDVRSATSALGEQLAELRQDPATRGRHGRRRRLESLAPDERDSARSALEEWVAWLVRTYELELTFPACWTRHPGMVEELGGLAEWHAALYDDLADDPRASVAWHEAFGRFRMRALPSVLNRCVARHQGSTGEDAENHRDDVPSADLEATAVAGA